MKRILVALFLIVIVVLACKVIFPPDGGKKVHKADPKAAETILKNLATVMNVHRVQNKDVKSSAYASDLSEISDMCANKIKPALPGPDQKSFYGYIVRLEEWPMGDKFATNFRLVAYPASGYKGETFYIDKREVIEKLNEWVSL